jgi:hypothetical protein
MAVVYLTLIALASSWTPDTTLLVFTLLALPPVLRWAEAPGPTDRSADRGTGDARGDRQLLA